MTDVRAKLKTLMRETLADEFHNHDWTYHAVRPMPVPSSWHAGQRVVGDCSKGCQYLCKWAGAPDPMFNNFGTWGNSSTLAAHLKHVDHPSDLEVGDIITFGPGGSHHAAMVMEAGNDPLLWSFGHQGAPNSYRLSHDRRERQYLKLNLPHHVLTPREKLRAKTGYWSWLQWKLGEGDWKGHKKANGQLRPNVPKRIPLEWWKLYAKFLKNRKKANGATT